MKKFILTLLCFQGIALSTPCFSQGTVNPSHHTVKEHTTKNGTVVKKHEQTDPNKTKKDNYSTKGNTNPKTGKKGTKNP